MLLPLVSKIEKLCALQHAFKSAFSKQGFRVFITAQLPLLPELSYFEDR